MKKVRKTSNPRAQGRDMRKIPHSQDRAGECRAAAVVRVSQRETH